MDIALKQRLVGASVLIALAVVVLPMMLGGGPEDEGTRKLDRGELALGLRHRRPRYDRGPDPVQDGRQVSR